MPHVSVICGQPCRRREVSPAATYLTPGRLCRCMHSWEVACIEVEDERDVEDCRAIREVGYYAPSLSRKSADVVGAQIHQGHAAYHVVVEGERVPLQAGTDPDGTFYVRTLDEDSPEDPLLELRTCRDLEREERNPDVA